MTTPLSLLYLVELRPYISISSDQPRVDGCQPPIARGMRTRGTVGFMYLLRDLPPEDIHATAFAMPVLLPTTNTAMIVGMCVMPPSPTPLAYLLCGWIGTAFRRVFMNCYSNANSQTSVEEALTIRTAAQARNTIVATDLALEFVVVGQLFVCFLKTSQHAALSKNKSSRSNGGKTHLSQYPSTHRSQSSSCHPRE